MKNIVLSKKFFLKESSYFTEYNFKDKTYVANIKSIPELKLGIILTNDENEIKNVPRKLGIIISIIAFVGVLIVIPIIYIVIRKLFKPNYRYKWLCKGFTGAGSKWDANNK